MVLGRYRDTSMLMGEEGAVVTFAMLVSPGKGSLKVCPPRVVDR
jgi:hypothetical protein